jgi:hypothetical protein
MKSTNKKEEAWPRSSQQNQPTRMVFSLVGWFCWDPIMGQNQLTCFTPCTQTTNTLVSLEYKEMT